MSKPSPWNARNKKPPIKLHGQDPFKAGAGPSYGGSKVTEDYVRAIRSFQAVNQCTVEELAVVFPKLKPSAILEIIKGRSWRNVR